MRIECDKCAAKYSIADEKVRGKTFKIRCKKCSNVIIVRDKSAAAGAEGAAASEPAAADEPAGWHLAIDGDTVGPLSEDEVRRRYDAGQVDKSTSVWQEGFEDWIELGQVEAFADLPERPSDAAGLAAGAGLGAGLGAASAPADDPFAASGSDDAFAASSGSNFDAGGGGGGFGEPAPAAAPAAAAAEESPRVDSLTGQRNENSVLFSLDSLKAMASSQKPASAGPVRQAPSTTAPSSEGSGLIDIRAMGAMMEAPAASSGGGGAPADEDMLPTFGGGGLGGLSVEPLVTEPPPAATPAPTQEKRSNAPMYILIGLLAAGLIGLGAMIMMKEDEGPQVIEKVVQVPGAVQDKDKDEDEDEDEDKDKDEDKDDKEDAGKEEAGETGDAAEAAENGAGSSGKSTKKSTKKSSSSSGGSAGVAGSGGGSSSSSSGDGGSSSSSGGGSKKEPDVDCLLDPNLPKCKGGSSGGGGETKKAPDPSLPKKLGTTQIKSGIDGIKAAAKACGGKNGAAPGTKVTIKFSVKGSTGSVISATATGENAGSALGKCVEAAAKKASFPKFQADQQGFQFNFRM